MVKRGIDPIESTYSALIKGYSMKGNMERVFEIITEIESGDEEISTRPFNAAINGCAERCSLEDAELLFSRLKESYGLTPDIYTYNSMLNVCASAKNLDRAKEVIEEMKSNGIAGGNVTLNTIINVYAESCNTYNAKTYLEECKKWMEEDDTRVNEITYSAVMKLCARGSLFDEGFALLDEIKERGLVTIAGTYNSLGSGILRDKKMSNDETNELFERLVDEVKNGNGRPNVRTMNTLISIALKLEKLEQAHELFNRMKDLDMKLNGVTYSVMLKCYFTLGDSSLGDAYLQPLLDLLEECEQEDIDLELPGYIYLLNACANVGNLDIASVIWGKLVEEELKPKYVAYDAMVNVCLSVNDTEMAFNLVDEMKTLNIKPKVSTYVQFVNYFTDKNDIAGVERIRKEMDSMGVIPNVSIMKKFEDLGI
eukprot:g357.t1